MSPERTSCLVTVPQRPDGGDGEIEHPAPAGNFLPRPVHALAGPPHGGAIADTPLRAVDRVVQLRHDLGRNAVRCRVCRVHTAIVPGPPIRSMAGGTAWPIAA